ncbi:hypothetical protein GCM10009539_29000 [Cryptosporangium japonicum]|uniref:histidine kinase n=1 Tax=Cryptosporangium japonicum TaxID=80872 RepID=A0ABP3DVN9_9ACTN
MLTVLFWADLAVVVVTHLLYPGRSVAGFAPLVLLLGATVLLWPTLRWRRGSTRWAASAAFVVVVGAVTVADGSGSSVFLVLIALANVALAFGLRPALLATAGLSAWLGIAEVVVVHKPVDDAVYQSVGVMLFAAFVLGLGLALTQAREARDRADRLVTELAAAHEELRAYAGRVHTLAVAEERARMARELHDSVGHYLTVIKVGLENAERYRERDPDAAWTDVRQAKTLTADALQEVRRGVRAMRPPMLDGRRGSDALRELARSFDGTGLQVDVRVDGDERELDETRELVLFRALQEALTNALRHSGGSSVSVRLGFVPGAVHLAVSDDGHGDGSRPRGFGLTSLAERVRAVGGALHTGNEPGGGFLVRVDLPEPA